MTLIWLRMDEVEIFPPLPPLEWFNIARHMGRLDGILMMPFTIVTIGTSSAQYRTPSPQDTQALK